jgi:hypothetical protein
MKDGGARKGALARWREAGGFISRLRGDIKPLPRRSRLEDGDRIRCRKRIFQCVIERVFDLLVRPPFHDFGFSRLSISSPRLAQRFRPKPVRPQGRLTIILYFDSR